MDNITIASFILLGIMFLLAYLANLATKRIRRWWLYVGFLIAAACFLVVSAINASDQVSTSKTWLISYDLFLGIGLVWPQLMSQIATRQNIKNPVIFLGKAKHPLAAVIAAVLFLAYLAWVGLMPHTYSILEHKPVYDEFYVLSSFSFLLFYIPFIILLIEMMTQRTAFCENGIYRIGLISDWSDFRSYTWIQNEIYSDPDVQPLLNNDIKIELLIEPKKSISRKPIRFVIPFDDKSVIENLLSRKLPVQQNEQP